MRKALFILVIGSFAFIAETNAQQAAELFCGNNFKEGSGVSLKWLYNKVYAPQGFDVYRKDSDAGNWNKINDQPVVLQKTLSPGINLDKEATELYNALKNSDYETLTSMLRVFSLIKAIYSEELAVLLGIRYDDKTAANGNSYTYKITLSGSSEAICEEKTILCESYSKPNAPSGLKLTRSKEWIDITWQPEIYRYYAVDVYRKGLKDSTFQKITPVPRAIQKSQTVNYTDEVVYYTDTSIVYEESYIYTFIAIDYFGEESIYSEEYSVPVEDFILPLAPLNVRPTASSVNQSVRVEWELIDEPDLAGTNIYWALSAQGPFEKINQAVVPKTTTYFDHNNTAVGDHYYKVATIDQAGNENYSGLTYTEVKDITPPSPPRNLQSTAEEGKITLTWTANNEGDLLGYFVQRSLNDDDNSDNKYVNVNSDPITETTWVNELARNIRNKFVYRIVAVDTSFNRSLPSANSLAQMPDVIPPKVPQIRSVNSEREKLVVYWIENVDPDLAGYNLYRRAIKDSGNLVQVNVNLIPASAAKYTDRRAEAGIRYAYSLAAVDITGNMSESSAPYGAYLVKKEQVPELKFTEKKLNKKKKQLSLSWELSDMNNLRGFVVFKEDPSGVMKPYTQLSQETNLKRTLTEGQHKFQVRGYLISGTVVSSAKIEFEFNSNNN